MKNLFTQIKLVLCDIYEFMPQGHDLTRIHSLCGFVTGMINKGSSYLPDIGSGLPQNIDANSKTTAAKRFVENKWIDYETHYLPFVEPFLRGILAFTPIRSGIRLVIDGSQMGKNNAALMVSLVWQNRGIPICWFVKHGSKGHFTEEDHIKVLQSAAKVLLPILPKKMPVVLLGDGEFDGIELQKTCLSYCWDYVFRTACDTVLYENGDRFQAKDIKPFKKQGCAFIQDVEFTEKRFEFVNFLCWHDLEKHQDPIFLISSLSEAGDIMEFYDQRYSIECLFKDLKSTSFNLHQTRLKNPQEVFVLIIIAALAFILIATLAMNYDLTEWRKKVQRVRKDTKVLSFFTFAFKLVHYFLDNDIGFNFSFQFSKNYVNSP